MKRHIITILLATAVALSASAQEKKENIKTGWNFGPLPAVSYNSDLGFQYGALCDIYYFGDGSTYPTYLHKFNVELSRYTKGETIMHLFYDSKYLLPKDLRLTAAISYLDSQMSPFYGYNGYLSEYISDYADREDMGSAFYSMDRDMLRVVADVQGKITDNLIWMGGLTFWNVKTDRVQLDNAKGKVTLYDWYRNLGIISENEISGTHLDFKAGLVYDTRDYEPAPNRGYYAEFVGLASPDLLGKDQGYLRFLASWKHFIPIYKDRAVFAYRISWQETFGNAPFYMQQNIQTLYFRQIKNEGLGGKNTVRGLLQGRMLGDGYVWANVEARIKLVKFRFINQNWYLATNPFIDMGMITRQREVGEVEAAALKLEGLYDADLNDGIHASCGIGLKLVMNENFIVALDWGKPLDKRDGKSGMNIGVNYVF